MSQFLASSIEAKLGGTKIRVCKLTGKILFPGEEIVIFPKQKHVLLFPLPTDLGFKFAHFTFMPFYPKKDEDLYKSKGERMMAITNVAF